MELRGLLCVVKLIVGVAASDPVGGTATPHPAEWTEFSPKMDVEHVWTNKDFMFPDQLQRLKKQLSTRTRVVVPLSPQPQPFFTPRGCGEDVDYCEEVGDYPDQETIRQIVRNGTSEVEAAILFDKPAREIQVREKAAIPLTNSRLRPGVADTITTEDRTLRLPEDGGVIELAGKSNFEYNNFIEESPVCASTSSYVYPKSARNLDKQWRFIVNLNDSDDDYSYTQAVKVEKCLRSGESCDVFSYGGSKTACRQKYSKRKLLALDDKGQQYIESFWFPSYCVCYKLNSYDYSGLELLRTKERTVTLREDMKRNDFDKTVAEIESQIEVQEDKELKDDEFEILPGTVERNDMVKTSPRLTDRRRH